MLDSRGMNFEYSEIVTHPLDVIYPLLRDDMASLLPYLPDVKQVEVLERDPPADGKHRIVNKWYGDSSNAPAAIRPFVTDDMVTWIDHARWIDAQSHVHWRMETASLHGLYDCRGTNYLEDMGDGTTRIRLTGALEIYPEKVPGLPKFMAKRLRPHIERYLSHAITPNLQGMPRAVQRYLDEQAG